MGALRIIRTISTLRVFWALAAVLLLALPALPRTETVPYITDVFGEDNVKDSPSKGTTENGALRLIGTFKLYNPDTVSFYLWVTFDHGGKFTHVRNGEKTPTIRLVDLELRYKNAQQRPVVKPFPKNGNLFRTPVRRRVGWASTSGSAGRFGKKKQNRGPRPPEQNPEIEAQDDESSGGARSGRSMSAVEITFWREDVQPYYEMELWGVLYAPDVKEASTPGSYAENISFEIEVAK
jgi:hypothetical protein